IHGITDTSDLALQSVDLSQFAATTSAELAGVISDETGTGVLVYNNTPTILTPTIASFINSQHDHSDAAGGGTLPAVTYEEDFEDSDLSSGILTVTHGLATEYLHTTVWNDSGNIIEPDEVTATSTAVTTIDLSSFTVTSDPDFWHVRVSK
ncbi:unnamed protein product, partial [marine sediment metagenome]